MAKVTIGGEELEVPEFMFRQKREASVILDRLNLMQRQVQAQQEAGTPPQMETTDEMAYLALQVIAIGLRMTGPEKTAEQAGDELADRLKASEAMGLLKTLTEILREMGLIASGEPAAAASPVTKGRSPNKSTASSPS